MARSAILIPGIMGSELWLGKELIWPGRPRELLLPYKKMEELMQDNLEARDVIRSVSISEQYGFLIDDLRRWGFNEGATPPTLRVFPYDWRKSNRLAAGKLADLLDKVFDEHGDTVEVSLIAHSMGGLISRFYLESGLYNERRGFRAVRQLLTLATPHRGAPLALTAAIGSERRLFLNAAQVKRLANDPRYPSLYELLPPPGEPFAWDEAPGAAYQSLDMYSAELAAALGLLQENLNAAQELQRGLDLRRRPDRVRYFFFVGSHQVTLSSVLLFKKGSGYDVRRVDLEDAGDGTVPIWSAALTSVQGRPVGGEHGGIYKSVDLRRTLAGLLGVPGMLGAIIPKAEVSIRDKVVEPSVTIHIALNFPEKVRNVRGVLSFEKVEVTDTGKERSAKRSGPRQTLNYSGVAVDSIAVVLVAPAKAGFYRVLFHDLASRVLYGKDDLVVQESSVASKLGVAKKRKPQKRVRRSRR